MHRAIVKFHALPDANGTATDHGHFLLRYVASFVLCLVGRVEIGRACNKFCGARVHHFIDGPDTIAIAESHNFAWRANFERGDALIGKPKTLSAPQQLCV